jgi:hypothetical protein
MKVAYVMTLFLRHRKRPMIGYLVIGELGNDVAENGHNITQVLRMNLRGSSERNHDSIQPIQPTFRLILEPITIRKRADRISVNMLQTYSYLSRLKQA